MNPDRYLVAVDAPLKEALTYLAPTNGEILNRGHSVKVPLGKRTARGVILGSVDTAPSAMQLKAILESVPARPILSPAFMDWLEWLARYYIHPIGQIVESVFPPLEKGGRGSRKDPVVNETLGQTVAPQLTVEQQTVVGAIQSKADFGVHLLHGVTGSGKTEVYLRLLESVVANGDQALVLVPEISLTPQLIDRFSRRFPGTVAVLHSHLTEREKTTQWWSAVDGGKQILIGARSALFCPLQKLKLIILDEEHEPSYKQDEKLKYHARDAAIVLAKNLNIPVVLGSATPSMESWSNALQGKYHLHTMTERVNARPLPEIMVVDLRQVLSRRKDEPSKLPFWLSDELHDELKHVFAKDEQAALFLNRRGMAQSAQCHACGFVAECPNCSVSLTLHARSYLVCHYCDYSEKLTEICPDCKDAPMAALGLGTEKVEADIALLFPEARIARADRDEVQNREQLEKLIHDFESGETNLLIGTQMIAKGLDFPKLNLVGLVLADIGFHWPDLRASERSFQLLTQVAGRSGRQTPGRVVIQTYDPAHPAITHTLAHDFTGFAENELRERQDLLYPPAWRMALFKVQSLNEEEGSKTSRQLAARANTLKKTFPAYESHVEVLGPATAPIHKLRNKFRYQLIVKCDSVKVLNSFCRQALGDGKWIPSGTKVQVDIDPFSMM
jgi:primosomal protein N' (replication factor Y)